MKAKDMREKSVQDLVELEKSLVREAFQARFKNFTARLDDTSLLGKARRDIARVKTILAERANVGEATPTPAVEVQAASPKATKKAPGKSKAKAPKASEASK
jgi:large subunit ribosomal protein L29